MLFTVSSLPVTLKAETSSPGLTGSRACETAQAYRVFGADFKEPAGNPVRWTGKQVNLSGKEYQW